MRALYWGITVDGLRTGLLPMHSIDAACQSQKWMRIMTMPSSHLATSRPVSPGTPGKILIVEDDPGLQLVLVELFTTMGYATLTASNAAAALTTLKNNRDVIMLFSDVVMPGEMDGIGLADAARKIYPELRILLASGYPQKDLTTKTLPKYEAFISKPYRSSELEEQMRELGIYPPG